MSGDGVDIAAAYALLREVADTAIRHDDGFVAIDRKLDNLGSQVSGLRQTVIEYHASCSVMAS